MKVEFNVSMYTSINAYLWCMHTEVIQSFGDGQSDVSAELLVELFTVYLREVAHFTLVTFCLL